MCAHAQCGGLYDLFVSMSNEFPFFLANVFGFMIFFPLLLQMAKALATSVEYSTRDVIFESQFFFIVPRV